MSGPLFSHGRPGARPGREQNLFIGVAKHVYCLKDGTLKYQKKALDPRLSNKQLITRFVLLDIDTGILYGEYHEAGPNQDLAGFLARAWSLKPAHYMRGIPSLLNISKTVRENDQYRRDLSLVQEITNIQLGNLPSGFNAGVHAVKQFDQQVLNLLWYPDKEADIFTIQALSAVLSTSASDTFSYTWEEKWKEVAQPLPEFYEKIDALYKQPGAWRTGPYEYVLNGLPSDN